MCEAPSELDGRLTATGLARCLACHARSAAKLRVAPKSPRTTAARPPARPHQRPTFFGRERHALVPRELVCENFLYSFKGGFAAGLRAAAARPSSARAADRRNRLARARPRDRAAPTTPVRPAAGANRQNVDHSSPVVPPLSRFSQRAPPASAWANDTPGSLSAPPTACRSSCRSAPRRHGAASRTAPHRILRAAQKRSGRLEGLVGEQVDELVEVGPWSRGR